MNSSKDSIYYRNRFMGNTIWAASSINNILILIRQIQLAVVQVQRCPPDLAQQEQDLEPLAASGRWRQAEQAGEQAARRRRSRTSNR